jgi:putative FmdB family regulatory protein
MPLYEYECPFCKTTAEVIQKFEDPAPVCANDQHSEGMRRLVSAPRPAVVQNGTNASYGKR